MPYSGGNHGCHLGVSLSELPVLDPRPLEDLLAMGATQGLIRELVVLYEEDVPLRVAALRTALASQDARQTMMEAHQLKGALGNLGLLHFADLAARIEQQAREGRLALAPPLADALAAAYEAALKALNAAFPEP